MNQTAATAPSKHAPSASAPTTAPDGPTRSHREVLEAISGLMLGLFVAILSSTVVTTSLPRIISDLGGSQSSFTWVVTASLLATTVSTPIWGKFADLFDRKSLVQLSLLIFAIGSVLGGLSESTGFLIFCRAIQGLGAGGLTALVQIVLADLISPRERGRYSGILGSVFALGSAGGPLLGGVVTDSAGWRWNFYIVVPIAAAAIILLQKTLHLPARPPRKVTIDYLGAALIASGISLLLIWVRLAGKNFAWLSTDTALMVGGSILLLALAVIVEMRAKEPIIPLGLFRNRTVVLSVIASAAIGVTLFGTSVFLSQYMQLARGKSPTESGLLTLPLVIGSLVASTVIGQRISRTGTWKPYMIVGSFLMLIGISAMGTLRYDTNFTLLVVYMSLIGLGLGMVMQNLVLIVQNSVSVRQLGTASSTVAFFRTLGGAIGVSALGAVLGSRVTSLSNDGLADLGVASTGSSGAIPVLSDLPAPVRVVIESAYGEAVGDIFLVAIPLAVLTIVMVMLLPNRPLGTKSATEQLAEEETPVTPTDPVYTVPTGTASEILRPRGSR